jgi:dolichol-phosphate mannosyltransferase
MNLTVLVPFFNEENTLRDSVMRVINELPESKIILIDDKSIDDSLNIAKELGKEFQNIKILENPTNLGKGAALKLSKDHIDTSHVIIHDADLEYFPKDIKNLFIKALDCPKDMILGSRFIGNKERKNLYRRTLIANKVMSKFFSLVYGVNISDIATCYKLMPVEYFKNIELLENGFSIEIEIVAKFVKGNKKVHELPISYIGRSYEEGKKIKVTDGFKYIFNTLRYRFI